MTADDLLARLCEEAARLAYRPVRKRDLRAWVDRGLVPPATAHGRTRGKEPTWRYSEESARAAIQIVRLRSLGVARTHALLLHLWADGFELRLDDVKVALNAEFRRFLKRQHRLVSWDYEPSQTPPAQSRQRLARYAAQLDSRFSDAGIAIQPDVLASALREAFWPTLKALGRENGGNPLALFSGLLADPEHALGGVLELLATVTDDDLRAARDSSHNYFALASVGAAFFQAGSTNEGVSEAVQMSAQGDGLIVMLATLAAHSARTRTE